MKIFDADVTGSLHVSGSGNITGNLSVTGSLEAAELSGSLDYGYLINVPSVASGLVSGSSQISYSGLTGVPSGIVSGSSQINITGTTGYSNITLQSVTDNGSSTDNPIVVESSNANKGVLGVEDLTISYYDNVGGQYHEQFIGGTNLDGLGYAGIKFGNGQVDGVFAKIFSDNGTNIWFEVDGTTVGDWETTGVTVSGVVTADKLVVSGGASTEFLKADGSVDTNTYLTQHPTISAASSSNNSGRTYIQDIFVDGNGHITGITTATETVVNTDTNYYTTGATFNTSTGVITLTRNDGNSVTVDIDGKYLALSGGTLTGNLGFSIGTGILLYNTAQTGYASIVYNETDNYIQIQRGLQPSTNNYANIGSSVKRFNYVYGSYGDFVSGVTAGSFTKTGGLSTQFLKADGSVDSSTYLTQHPTISAASSSNNSGRTYIQDILLDANGHITGITTATETVVNTNYYSTGVTFSGGTLTIGRNGGLGDLTVSLDGRYLTAHPSVTAATSSNNSGRTYIQDILLDSFGHITGITTATETVVNTDTIDYVSNVQLVGNVLRFTGVGSAYSNDVDLSVFASDVTITGGSYNSGTQILTLTKSDGNTVAISGFAVDTDTNTYVTGATFSGGTLSLKRKDGLSDVTVSLDGRYLTGYTETDTLDSVTDRGNTTTNNITVGNAYATVDGGFISLGSNNSSTRISNDTGGGKGTFTVANTGGTITGAVQIAYTLSEAYAIGTAISPNKANTLRIQPNVEFVSGFTSTGNAVVSGATLNVTSTVSGTTVFSVDGVNGRLFAVSDDLSNSLFSVNTISGLPVIEAFSDYHIVMGRFNQNDFYLGTTGEIGMGIAPVSGYKLAVSGNVRATSFVVSGGTSSQFLKADGSVDSSTYLTQHPSVVAASSSNNSGRTYIQDILVDSFGHITGITTATETVVNTDTNYYTTGATFNTADGVVTFTTNTGGTYTVDIDGRFLTAHPSVSAASSSNNSGRTYIQDILLDSFGHITGITTATETVVNTDTITRVGISGSEASGTVTLVPGGAIDITQVGGSVTITHADTSSTSSSNNSGRTYIQDVLLDGYGHVTGLTTATESVVNTDTNYYTTGATFNTGNGVITGTLNNGSTWTVDIDGRYSTTDTDTITRVGTSGNEVSGTVTLADGGATTVTQVGNTITISSVNTTYSAGSGLVLSGTTFSHADTSATASSNNSGRTYIQDVLLDTYGHVTGLTTATETVTNTDTNYYLTGATFNSGDGVITLTLNDASTVTVDIDGRFLPLAGGTMTGALNMGNFNITNINSLAFGDPGPNEGITWTGGNGFSIYESPNDLTTNTAGNLQFVVSGARAFTLNSNKTVEFLGNITAPSFIKSGGTSAQFLKADGSVDSSTYLTQHPTVVAASSSNNSGRTYIQDILLDGNGHITGITTATETVVNTDSVDYVSNVQLVGNTLRFTGVGNAYSNDVDLSVFASDVTITGGSYNSGTQVLTLTKSDGNTVAISGFAVDTDTNSYVTGATFNTGDGVLTLNRNGGLSAVTVDLDGRYLTTYTDTNYYTTGATFNTSTGVITGTNNNGGTWTVDIDGRFLTAHPAVSAASSSNNSGRTYIQDILLDSFGHITGITTATETVTNTDTITRVGISGSEVTGTVTLASSGAASVTQVGNTITISSTNTTYSAGSGLSLSGTAFSHADTSTQASSNNSGRTYIQDVLLDTYGHVTGLTTATETVTNTDTNYYLTGATFNTGDGVVTMTLSNGSTVTVDLDGRFTDNGYADAMNQYVRTTDTPTFVGLNLTAQTFNSTNSTFNSTNFAVNSTNIEIGNNTSDVIDMGGGLIRVTNNLMGVNTDSPTALVDIVSTTSGSTVFSVSGTQGQLFSITDSLTGTLFSINDISGLPILQINSDDSVIMGRYNQNDFYLGTTGDIGMGTAPVSGTKLTVSGTINATSFVKSGGTSSQFLMGDGSVSTNPGWITGHPSVSAASSSNNSGRTYIQDILLDGYGHITGITTATETVTNTDTNYYLTGATFNTGNGIITLTRNDGTTVTVDIDGKYAEASHTHSYLPLAGGTMTGDITFSDTGEGVVWTMNTDGAYIKFYNTGDADTNSRLEYGTSDNGNEFHRWMVSTIEEMTLKSDGLRVADSIWMGGNLVATQTWVSSQNYLTQHPSITAASSSNNSGRTYIQDILLDGNGHVTGITTATETVVNTDTNYYTTGSTFNGSTGVITFTRNNGGTYTVDISSTLSDVTVTGGTYNSGTQTLRLTKSNGTTVDITGFAVDTDTNYYTTGATFNTGNGIITGTRNDGGTWTVDIDGRFLLSSGTAVDSDKLDGYHLTGSTSAGSIIFNNKGQNHTTVSDFNTIMTPGANFIQGGTNGPTGTATHQWYGLMLGLGADYGTSTGSGGHYANQLYWARQAQGGGGYLWARDMEGGSWGSWRKMSAGYADTAGTSGALSNMNISQFTNDSGYITQHPTISAASSSNNSGRTYIQDILLDTYGHITGITTATETVTNTDTNYYTTGATFNTSTGVVTFTRNNGGTYTVDIDGRYLEAESDTLATVTARGASTSTAVTMSGGATITSLTVAKSGTDSLITFPAQTNDPGFIKHYESSNTARMYFSVSDDTGTTDYFGFGYSADQTRFIIYSNGAVYGKSTAEFDGRIYADDGLHVRGDWVRVDGSNGLYFETYGGGWNMSDATWIRSYGGKQVYIDSLLEVGSGGIQNSGNFRTLNAAGNTWVNVIDRNAGAPLMYASVYYDFDNTAYYVNPASNSNMGTLNLTSTSSGSEVLAVDGVNGRLFTITDDLSNSLFSVNTISGLPVIEAFSDYSVIMGRYNQNDFNIDSLGNIGMGTVPSSGYKLYVNGNLRATAFVKTGGTSAQFLMADGSVSTNPGWLTGHPSVSAASSSNNSGRTYIQDILLDSFGHITGITTATETVTNTDTNYYTTGATFSTSTGVITGTRNDGGTWTVDIDGRYLTAHPSVSAASSSNNSGRTYIQDILLDSFGHITGITTATETVVNSDTITRVGVSGSEVTGTVTLAASGAVSVSQVGSTITFTHTDTSAQSSVNNSGRTYIQDILLDTYGHITGITSATETVVNTDTNYYTTGATFNTGNGVITLTRNDGGTVTVDIDGRYAYASHTHPADEITTGTFSGDFTFSGGAQLRIDEPVEINGDLTVNGLITENSSIRYKKDVQTIEDGLSKVLSIRGVSYLRRDNDKKEVGVIAEEIAKVLPEVVIYNTEGEPDSVSYGRITAILIEAIKDLKKEIDTLKGNQ